MSGLPLGLALACVVLLALLHREALRRVLLRAVDPRPLALFRIAFGACLLGNLCEVWPHQVYLFSDEGLLPSAAVAQVQAPLGLAGLGDGVHEPAGLRGLDALAHHLASGQWSLLFFVDDPAFVRLYLGALVLAALGLTLGWRTRTCAVAAWLLYAGLLRRGDAHWGGEQVFTAFLFPLALSRCGDALSLDNLLRCRALRRRGALSLAAGPGGGAGLAPCAAHPRGLAAVYRRIPAWPQALIAGQLALCYFVNGWVKSGPAWRSGDALAAALLYDPHTRWDAHQWIVALGPWPLRLATWGALWWERLFPLALVGLWLHARARAAAPALVGRAHAAARACWAALAFALALAAAVPEALVEAPGPSGQERSLALALVAAAAAWFALGPRAPASLARAARAAVDPRLWLGAGVLFHAANLALLNVGAFALATLAAYLVCGAAPTVQGGLRRLGGWAARRGLPVPTALRDPPLPAEDPSLPALHRDAAALPGPALALGVGLVAVGGALALSPAPPRPVWWWHGAWLASATCLIALGRRAARHPAAAAHPGPWAYGPAGRLAAGGALTYHVVALLAWQVPAWPGLPHARARELVRPWVELTRTSALWSMFAPNPPAANRALRTTVVDARGEPHDLRTELEHPEHLRRPYLWPDRMRKVHEAVAGARPRLARWHARHLCRRWAQDHGGEPPARVVLERVVAPLPPHEPLDPRAWFWERARVESIEAVACADEPFAQLSDEVRARHGLPAARAGELRHAWPKDQPTTWAGRRALLDPLAPVWPLGGLALAVALALWARGERRGRAGPPVSGDTSSARDAAADPRYPDAR